MIPSALLLTAVAGVSVLLMADPAPAQGKADKPVVVLDTTAGPITIELDPAKAPITVENFLKYVDKGFYDGLIFHRVIPRFMIQGGGMKEVNGVLQGQKEGAFPAIRNESGNGLSNTRGTLAMARTNDDPNSATSQFFINHGNNAQLDNFGGGYTVFGKLIDGMDVVDAIAKVDTKVKSDAQGQPSENVPEKPIVIKSAKRKAQP